MFCFGYNRDISEMICRVVILIMQFNDKIALICIKFQNSINMTFVSFNVDKADG